MADQRTTPFSQTLPNSLFVWLQKYARKKDYKNTQALIESVLRDFKEKNETPQEKSTY